MCESSVYLVEGSEKSLVMAEVARVLADGSTITCVDILGERRSFEGAEIAETDLVRHEVILRKRRG